VRLALALAVVVALPTVAEECDGGPCQQRGVNGPVAGTRCVGPDDCKVDLTNATCTTDGGASSWPAPARGPACGCVKGACAYLRIEPVSCRVDADCALATEPVLHVIAAPPSKKKPRPFRPCKDGERQAVCVNQRCAIRAWSC